jgi:hypothetical protein
MPCQMHPTQNPRKVVVGGEIKAFQEPKGEEGTQVHGIPRWVGDV